MILKITRIEHERNLFKKPTDIVSSANYGIFGTNNRGMLLSEEGRPYMWGDSTIKKTFLFGFSGITIMASSLPSLLMIIKQS